MLQVKLVFVGIFVLMIMLVAFQNAESVMVQFFMWDTRMPLVGLVLGIAFISFLAGFIVGRLGPKMKRVTKRSDA